MRNDFFILSFFVVYILSFGLVRLRTIRLSARAGTHIERRCSRSCAKDVTITDVMIKNPDRKCDLGANDVMPGSDWQGFLVILKKKPQLVEIRSWARPVEIWSWTRRVQFVAYGMPRAFVGSDGTVSIVKIVCLSLSSCRKTKLKKSINVSYLN